MKALTQAAIAKKKSLTTLHELASHLLAVPASQGEKDHIRTTLQQLTTSWEVMCQVFPADVQVTLLPPATSDDRLRPPEAFEDIAQLMEWLIVVESSLQPKLLRVTDTEQVKRILKEILVSH